MKKLMLSLLCAGAMSIPATALALPTQAVFAVSIINGPAAILVGNMLFDLDADLPGLRQCRYYYEWDNAAILPISADGFVVETKTHGAASCLTNAMTPVLSIVQNFGPVTGFDRFQQFRPVSQLVLGENGLNGTMQGLIQFAATPVSPPSFMVNAIALAIAP
jgi:hypothetical protein